MLQRGGKKCPQLPISSSCYISCLNHNFRVCIPGEIRMYSLLQAFMPVLGPTTLLQWRCGVLVKRSSLGK